MLLNLAKNRRLSLVCAFLDELEIMRERIDRERGVIEVGKFVCERERKRKGKVKGLNFKRILRFV